MERLVKFKWYRESRLAASELSRPHTLELCGRHLLKACVAISFRHASCSQRPPAASRVTPLQIKFQNSSFLGCTAEGSVDGRALIPKVRGHKSRPFGITVIGCLHNKLCQA